MTDYVRLTELDSKTERKDNEDTLDFLIKMMNKADKSTISSNDFIDEIIAYCNRFNDKRYLFLTNRELLNKIYISYNFKRTIMSIINLYINNFIIFDDVISGITKKKSISKEKHNYIKLIQYEKQFINDIQETILRNKTNNRRYLSEYGFIIDNEKDVIYINNLINAYNSGLICVKNNDKELNNYGKFSKITIV